MAGEREEGDVVVTVSLTARVVAPDGRGGYDLKGEDGEVTISKFGASNRMPKVALADLTRAVEALKG